MNGTARQQELIHSISFNAWPKILFTNHLHNTQGLSADCPLYATKKNRRRCSDYARKHILKPRMVNCLPYFMIFYNYCLFFFFFQRKICLFCRWWSVGWICGHRISRYLLIDGFYSRKMRFCINKNGVCECEITNATSNAELAEHMAKNVRQRRNTQNI